MGLFQAGHRPLDALLMGQQVRAYGVAAYEGDDVGGYVLAGHFREGRVQLRIREACPVQGQPQIFQALTG